MRLIARSASDLTCQQLQHAFLDRKLRSSPTTSARTILRKTSRAHLQSCSSSHWPLPRSIHTHKAPFFAPLSAHHGHDHRLRKVPTIPYLRPPLTTQQLGGFTLTSAILYLSVSLHAQNRATQAALLRQQRNVLTNFYEPKEPEKEPRAREVPIGLAEMAKDRWNRVLEETVQTVSDTDWRRVRESAEDRLSTIAQKIREGGK